MGVSDTFKTIASLSLPAGNYIILGKAIADTNWSVSGYSNAWCQLLNGDSATIDESKEQHSGGRGFLSMPLQAAVTIGPAGGTVQLVCRSNLVTFDGAGITGKLAAVEVASLTLQ